MRTREATKAFSCLNCDDEWDTDPRLAVACPDCHATPGHPCKRPSGWSGKNFVQPHRSRRDRAWQLSPCDCLRQWDETHAAIPLGETPPKDAPRMPKTQRTTTLDLFTEKTCV